MMKHMEEEEEEEARHLTGLRTSQGGTPGVMGKFSWELCNASVHFVESTVRTPSARAHMRPDHWLLLV